MALFGTGAIAAASAQSAAAGAWSIQAVPDLARSSDTELSGVSCASTSDCVAVGFRDLPPTGDPVPLVVRWNGSIWSTDHTPTSSARGWSGWLSAVSCTSARACVAVGLSYSNESRPRPLAERWNGSAWSIERVPRLGDAEALDGVSCASSTDCIAVGYGRSSVAAHWDGTRWSAQDVRFGDPGGRSDALTSVSCTAGRCAAVGWDNVGLCEVDDDNFYDVPVLGFWTDRRWSLRRHPNVMCSNGAAGGDPGGHTLNGVSCTSRLACTAVGSGVYRWNGRRWSLQPAPIDADQLGGVSCASTSACTAVGSRVYTWNGLRWSTVPIPYPAGATYPELTGVSCRSGVACVAVGGYIDRALGGSMLIESTGMGATPVRQAKATSEGSPC